MKKILILLALMSALLVSCEKPENNEPEPEPEYAISISPAELTFGAEGGEAEVTVTSSDRWDISNRPDWIDVSERYGENGETIIVAVEEYNTEVDSRSGEIVFTCGNKEAKISVTQKADDSPIIQFKDQYFLDALLARYRVYWNDTEYYVDIDRNNDGQISEKEASSVEVLDLEKAVDATEQAIRNVDELSYFSELKYLWIAGPYGIKLSIESIDLSDLSQLEYLYIYLSDRGSGDRGVLKSLNVSGCSALTYLYCSYNKLTSLDVSNNTALESLYCGDNQLTSLDVSNNTALTYLWCYGNQLTSLDVSKNTALTDLYCYGNQLTSLDVSKNTALTDLYCYGNQLTSLDVSNNTALTYLWCHDNQLTSLDLYNNRLIESLQCKNNPLQKLILYKYHIIEDSDIESIESEYGDIIEYME